MPSVVVASRQRSLQEQFKGETVGTWSDYNIHKVDTPRPLASQEQFTGDKLPAARPSLFRSTPLKVKLVTDSCGRLNSKSKDYVHEVQTQVACQRDILIVKEQFTGGEPRSKC